MRRTTCVLLLAGLTGLSGCNKGAPDAGQSGAASPAAPVAAAPARAVSDGYVHFAGSGSVNCDARPLSLDGSHGRVEVSGACRKLRVTGEHNDVIVGMAPRGSIDVTGAHNDIWWHSTGRGPLPDLRNSGVSNTFHREDG